MLGLQVGSKVLGIGADVPIGVSAAILIGGTNDMTITQQMGARWEVRDPDDEVVDSYDEFEIWPYTGPGAEHGFIGNRFDLDKVGTYTVKADLLMNPDDPVIVDSYEGDLCTTTLEVPPEFDLIEETIYPYAYIYDGPSEVGTFTFTTIPFTPASWISGLLASRVEDEVRKAGGRIMEMRVYVDESQWRPWTNWRIEVVGTPLGAEVASGIAVGIPVWLAIILIALAIIAVIVVTYHFIIKPLTYKHKPGLEDVKPGWDKEALMVTIHASEEYWERPLTPTETLEGMSEAELRDLLDQIAEEEVPIEPEIPWAIAALVGGLGVVGLGAAFALTAKRE